VKTMPSILFVCTGNIFRSMTAEYALKASLDPRSPIRVSSAGTQAIPQAMHPDVRAYLMHRGMEPSPHQQRRVSAELLSASDLVWEADIEAARHYASMSWSTSVRLCRVY